MRLVHRGRIANLESRGFAHGFPLARLTGWPADLLGVLMQHGWEAPRGEIWIIRDHLQAWIANLRNTAIGKAKGTL